MNPNNQEAHMHVPAQPPELPEPWPGMIVAVQGVGTDTWIRTTIKTAFNTTHGPIRIDTGDEFVEWSPANIREVKTPDGATVWARA